MGNFNVMKPDFLRRRINILESRIGSQRFKKEVNKICSDYVKFLGYNIIFEYRSEICLGRLDYAAYVSKDGVGEGYIVLDSDDLVHPECPNAKIYTKYKTSLGPEGAYSRAEVVHFDPKFTHEFIAKQEVKLATGHVKFCNTTKYEIQDWSRLLRPRTYDNASRIGPTPRVVLKESEVGVLRFDYLFGGYWNATIVLPGYALGDIDGARVGYICGDRDRSGELIEDLLKRVKVPQIGCKSCGSDNV